MAREAVGGEKQKKDQQLHKGDSQPRLQDTRAQPIWAASVEQR